MHSTSKVRHDAKKSFHGELAEHTLLGSVFGAVRVRPSTARLKDGCRSCAMYCDYTVFTLSDFQLIDKTSMVNRPFGAEK